MSERGKKIPRRRFLEGVLGRATILASVAYLDYAYSLFQPARRIEQEMPKYTGEGYWDRRMERIKQLQAEEDQSIRGKLRLYAFVAGVTASLISGGGLIADRFLGSSHNNPPSI